LRSRSCGIVSPPEITAYNEGVAASLQADADVLLARRRDPAKALRLYEAALARGADLLDVAGNQWRCAMLLGDFERAWRISDAALRERHRRGLSCAGRPYHLRWVWEGSPLEGKRVLVRCYHGLGDVILFVRYAAPLRRIASHVVVQAVPQLLPLLRSVDGIDALIPLAPAVPEPPCDVEIELMEVPHALRATLSSIPNRVPYIHVSGDRLAARRCGLGQPGRLKVGVAWAAGAWKSERSVPLRLLRCLADVPGIDLINLQRGAALAELDTAADAPRLIEWGDRSEDLTETALTLKALDLVISVDTMIAHLAGALGVPVWTMLHHDSDWRWLLDRTDSPWYPTMRLFRQPAPGAWLPVVEGVAGALSCQATFH
jgi:hypothetical protein